MFLDITEIFYNKGRNKTTGRHSVATSIDQVKHTKK